jgi:hypothetical protein
LGIGATSAIFFIFDHGFYFGEHRNFGKMHRAVADSGNPGSTGRWPVVRGGSPRTAAGQQ